MTQARGLCTTSLCTTSTAILSMVLFTTCLHAQHTAYFAGIFSSHNVENTAQAALGSANRRLSRNLRPFSGHFQEFLQVRHTVKVVRYGTGPWRCAAGYGPLPSINGHLELEHRLQITGIMQIDQIGSWHRSQSLR